MGQNDKDVCIHTLRLTSGNQNHSSFITDTQAQGSSLKIKIWIRMAVCGMAALLVAASGGFGSSSGKCLVSCTYVACGEREAPSLLKTRVQKKEVPRVLTPQ